MQSLENPVVGQAFKSHLETRPRLFAAIGVLPLVALIGLVAFWGRERSGERNREEASPKTP